MARKSRRHPHKPTDSRRPLIWSHPRHLAAAAALTFALLAVYSRALHGPFIYDDFSLPFYKPGFPTSDFMAWISGVRPVLMLSYWINFWWAGRDSYSYHAVNLLIHFANGGLVFLIVRRILAQACIEDWRLPAIPFFACALFLLHPIQTESVAYVAGRSELLSAFFFLLAFALFLYRPAPAVDWRSSVVLLLLFSCAVATNEHTVTLPILLLFTDVYWATERPTTTILRNWRLYLPMLCGGLIAAAIVGIYVNTSTSAGISGAGVSWAVYALTECRVLFLYLRLLLFPASQNFDHDISWAALRFDVTNAASLLGVLLLLGLAWRLRKRLPVGCYGLLIFLLLLAPTSSFLPIKDAMAERRLYLPMLGFTLVAGECLLHARRQNSWAVATAGVLLAALGVATYQRSGLWSSEAALWTDTVAKSPNRVGDYGNLVHGLVEEHRCREALEMLNRVTRRLKPDATLLSHWSFAYECVNDHAHALEKLQQSVALLPWPSTYINMARHQLALDRTEDAVQSLDLALKLDPRLELAYTMRAAILEREGNLLAAAQDYRQALHVNPADPQASWHLRQVDALWQAMHAQPKRILFQRQAPAREPQSSVRRQ